MEVIWKPHIVLLLEDEHFSCSSLDTVRCRLWSFSVQSACVGAPWRWAVLRLTCWLLSFCVSQSQPSAFLISAWLWWTHGPSMLGRRDFWRKSQKKRQQGSARHAQTSPTNQTHTEERHNSLFLRTIICLDDLKKVSIKAIGMSVSWATELFVGQTLFDLLFYIPTFIDVHALDFICCKALCKLIFCTINKIYNINKNRILPPMPVLLTWHTEIYGANFTKLMVVGMRGNDW